MTENYFGDCPKCEGFDGYLNVGRKHWCVCDKCKTKWPIGLNLFSDWKYETEDVWKENAEKLAAYKEVAPTYEKGQGKSIVNLKVRPNNMWFGRNVIFVDSVIRMRRCLIGYFKTANIINLFVIIARKNMYPFCWRLLRLQIIIMHGNGN